MARILGFLRLHLGRELGLVDESAWRFAWITDFPMFKWDADLERWDAEHHPFTRPNDESLALLDTDPGAAKAIAYDLVGNGLELAGGSFRIHEPELQRKVFDLLRITPEEQVAKFGFLLEALSMGAPPHGGIAIGHRPPLHGAARRAVHPRHDRVPEEPGRRRPDDRCADRRDGAAACRARHRRDAPSRLRSPPSEGIG